MKAYGNAIAGGIYNGQQIPLPHANGTRPAHRPWCVDCKRVMDAEQLDDDQLCERCARAAVARAEAAVRRAERERQEAEQRRQAAASKPVVKREPRRRATPSRPRRPTPSASAQPQGPRLTPRPKTRAPRPPRTPPKPRGTVVDELAIVRQYTEGLTPPAIAAMHGILPKRVRTILDRHGIQRRDDRTRHSGGKPKEYDPQLVDQVRRLYIDEQLSRPQVADQLGITLKIVERIMGRYGIAARQRQAGRQDGARALKDQIRDLGVTVRDIKAWALERGLLNDATKPGIPSARVVAAYAEEHAR